MSDTPLTAKAKIACGFQAVPQSFLEHAENLERENDTLRKAYYKYESTLHDLRSVLDVTQLESFVQAAQRLKRENAALRSRCEELESERTQFANRAARLAAVEHELEESRKAERLARVQLQSEREARK